MALTIIGFEKWPPKPDNLMVVFAVPTRTASGAEGDYLPLRLLITTTNEQEPIDDGLPEQYTTITYMPGGETIAALIALTNAKPEPFQAQSEDHSKMFFPIEIEIGNELCFQFPVLRWEVPRVELFSFTQQSLQDAKKFNPKTTKASKSLGFGGIVTWRWMNDILYKAILNYIPFDARLFIEKEEMSDVDPRLGFVLRFLTVQHDNKLKQFHRIFGANPCGGMVNQWQIRHGHVNTVKHYSQAYYRQLSITQQTRFINDAPLPTDFVPYLRLADMIYGEPEPYRTLRGQGSAAPIPDQSMKSNTLILIDEPSELMYTVTHTGNKERDWHQPGETVIAHKLKIMRHTMDLPRLRAPFGLGEKPGLAALGVCHKSLPEAAKLSATLLCPRDGSLLFVASNPNAFQIDQTLTIAILRKREWKNVENEIAEPNDLLQTISVDAGVTGPPKGWTFTVMKDYYDKDGRLIGNEHSWVWWQKGRVLVGMMHNAEFKKVGAAFITFEYEDNEIKKITKFKLVEFNSRNLKFLFRDKKYAVRLVGHYGRHLVFRNGPTEFQYVRVLYRRMDRVPTDIAKAEWNDLNCTQAFMAFSQTLDLGYCLPHVSQVQIMAGGVLVLRCRYQAHQTEFMVRICLESMFKRTANAIQQAAKHNWKSNKEAIIFMD